MPGGSDFRRPCTPDSQKPTLIMPHELMMRAPRLVTLRRPGHVPMEPNSAQQIGDVLSVHDGLLRSRWQPDGTVSLRNIPRSHASATGSVTARQTAVPKILPMPMVSAIARMPQKVTRTMD